MSGKEIRSILRGALTDVSVAALKLRWAARDVRDAGHEEWADEMDRVHDEMEALTQSLHGWAGEFDPSRKPADT